MATISTRAFGAWMLCFFMILTACSKNTDFAALSNGSVGSTPETGSGSDPGDNQNPPQEPPFAYVPLLWEAVRTGSNIWSNFLLTLVKNDLHDMLDAAEDMVRFCPAFESLNENQKINTWGMLFSAIAKYESGFNPLSRMQETTMGTDPITGRPVYSEGLLQLSYQDIQAWPFCKFDWNKDKNLAPTDPKKTILDPLINLDCGARIMAQQIARYKKIVIDRGVYWAVIKENGRYQQINNIIHLVRGKLSWCQ